MAGQKIDRSARSGGPAEADPGRRRLLALGAAAGGGALLSACAAPMAPLAGPGPDFLIRDASVISMDPAVGDLPRGSVHVRSGRIEAVARDLEPGPGTTVIDGSGMILMPGFVETHWHLWSSATRNMLRDGVEYFALKTALIQHFEPSDFYIGNRLGLAEAAAAGITTVHNFAHNTRSPAHVDAELQAMAESGLRGRYSYGNQDPMPNDRVMPLEDALRVRREWFGGDRPRAGRLLHLGAALRGPALSSPAVYAEEYRAARAAGLPVALHIGQSKFAYVSAAKLLEDGLLDRGTLLVHGILQTDRDREAIRTAGASLSVSPQSELRLAADGDFRAQLLQMLAAGVNVCLSLDATTLSSVSMFDQMSAAWYVGVPWRGTPTERLAAVSFRRCLEMATINGARALGLDDRIGSVTPGKRADLIMVRATGLNMVPMGNPLAALVRAATVADVDTVFVEGRVIKRHGRLVRVDTGALRREAAASLFAIRRRAGGRWAPETSEAPDY